MWKNEILWSTKRKTKHHKHWMEVDCFGFNTFTDFSTHKKYDDFTWHAQSIMVRHGSLRTLDCQEGYFFTTEELHRIVEGNSLLTGLLIPYSFVDDPTLMFIMESLTKLAYISICETEVTKDCVRMLKLRKPSLEICYNVNHTPWKLDPKNRKTVSHVFLMPCFWTLFVCSCFGHMQSMAACSCFWEPFTCY